MRHWKTYARPPFTLFVHLCRQDFERGGFVPDIVGRLVSLNLDKKTMEAKDVAVQLEEDQYIQFPTDDQGCRICGSLAAGLPGTFFWQALFSGRYFFMNKSEYFWLEHCSFTFL